MFKYVYQYILQQEEAQNEEINYFNYIMRVFKQKQIKNPFGKSPQEWERERVKNKNK